MTDIVINKEQLDAVDSEEQQRITSALIEAGAMQQGDQIIGDVSAPAVDENTEIAFSFNPFKEGCKILCDGAAGTGLAWCTANTVGVGLIACVAAAEAARKECKKRC